MSFFASAKRFLFGNPIATKHAHHERLPVWSGLPVFASDALSSVAYATEEILLVLVLAGATGLMFLGSISWYLGILMLIVGFSYFQTIYAYPKGGGTYLVSTENLGSMAGRTAGASLLIDYVLTVAVSVSSGVSAIISLNSGVKPYGVLIGVGAVLLLMLANLRGAKESGGLFAIPTYSFVGLVLGLIASGFYLTMTGSISHVPPTNIPVPAGGFHAITPFLFLRAFAASCTALTGTEAIADGVQAFKPPEARNASLTLLLMVGLLLSMFLGLGYWAQNQGIVPMHNTDAHYKTVVAQIAIKFWGDGFLFSALQIATAAILFLAANTAYADFPRLCSFIARDGYLPRQLASLGDRLVFQNGIILLSLSAVALIVLYHADTHSLIPLYAMGVFISFTLSQSGMAVKFFKEKAPVWKLLVSVIGAFVTFVVLWILLITKFEEGAWLIIVALAVTLFIFSRIHKHYKYLANQLSLTAEDKLVSVKTTALLLVPRLHRGVLQAVSYAQSLTDDVRAVHVTLDPKNTQQIKDDWNRFNVDIPLVILDSPYRSLNEPVFEYIDQTIEDDPGIMVTVIVPQAVPKFWWQGLLHNNAAVGLKIALASRKNVVITNVRYFLR
ncbi:MAG: APC family permease [Fimbriimonadaceae bacterium]